MRRCRGCRDFWLAVKWSVWHLFWFGRFVQIIFNGQPRDIASHTSVAELLRSLDMTPQYVAVEVNLQLVPRQKHAEHVLNEGDQLEVVTLVGGG